MCQCPPVIRNGGTEESRTGNGSGASAGAGRGAGEECGAPVAYCGALVASRSGRVQFNQDDEGGGDGDRGDGVENDAEGAVVGVRLERVGVGDLGDGEEREQGKAQDRRRQPNVWVGEDGLASSLLELTQSYSPSFKNTLIWMRFGRGRLQDVATAGAKEPEPTRKGTAPTVPLGLEWHPAGAEALLFLFGTFAARLKSCPDTFSCVRRGFQQAVTTCLTGLGPTGWTAGRLKCEGSGGRLGGMAWRGLR